MVTLDPLGKLAARARTRGRAPEGEGTTHPLGNQRRPARRDIRLPRPGDILSRCYKGREITVLVLESGFEYEGCRFREAPNSPIGGLASPMALSAADLTGDGIIDLAVGHDDSNKMQILVGDGKGSSAVGTVPDLEAGGDCLGPVLADLNGDGRLDVVATAVNDAPTFSYWINLGGGKFSPAHQLQCMPVASRICVTDVNGDRAPDLVVGTWNEGKLQI